MKQAMALGMAITLVSGLTARVTQSPRKPIAATIAQVGWMEGTWVGEAGGVSVEERWTPPAGGTMLAVSRTLKNGRLAGFEFLRIVERDGGLVYVAQPGMKPPTDFTLTALTESSATFENPDHDFPKLIRYTKRPDGALEARVGDGGAKDETYLFRRAPL